MSGSHGDLFQEIGKIVLAADAGHTIDLRATSQDLADRYVNLGMSASVIARAIARSLGAIGVSMTVAADGHDNANGHRAAGANGHTHNGTNGHAHNGVNGSNGHSANGHEHKHAEATEHDAAEADEPLAAALPADVQAKAASALFPSGLRISLLS